MKIINVPHPSLRLVANPITTVDDVLVRFVTDMKKTLNATKNPKGVGLAAPQVDKNWRIFVSRASSKEIEVFINPVIVKHGQDLTLGPDPEEPVLEGCLSIPNLYGAVPRWQWIEIEYQTLVQDTLQSKKIRLDDFPARVAQHEVDHLNGILFTDHSLEYDLPVYQENTKTKKVETVERTFLELL